MSIKSMLRNALLITGLLVTISIAATLYGNHLATSAVNKLAFSEMPATQTIQALVLEYERMRKYEKEYFVFAANVDRRSNYEKEWEKAYATIGKLFSDARADSNTQFTAVEKSKLREWNDAIDSYAKGFRELVKRVTGGVVPDGLTANSENGKNVDHVRPFGKDAPAFLAKQVADSQTAAGAAVSTVRGALIGIVVLQVLVLLALVFAYLRVPKAIGATITSFSEAVDKMSKGDAKSPLPETGLAEFEPLSQGLGRLQKSLGIAIDRLKSRG